MHLRRWREIGFSEPLGEMRRVVLEGGGIRERLLSTIESWYTIDELKDCMNCLDLPGFGREGR
jgi:hypothetical protein